MAKFTVPESGLVLDVGASPNASDGATAPSVQVMQLDLADGTLDELLKCARHGGKPIHVAFGKTIVCERCSIVVYNSLRKYNRLINHQPPQSLQYGTKTRRLDATPSTTDTQIFTSSSNTAHKLSPAGRVSHQLAMAKAEEQLANTDDALAQLQASLAFAKQAKDSNQ